MSESETISLLKERLDHFQTRLTETEIRAKSAEKDTIDIKTRLDKRETQVVSLGSALVLSAALFGLISWASFGSWVSSALQGTAAKETLASLEISRQDAEKLIAQMQVQVRAPITLLGKVPACQEQRFDPPFGTRDDFTLMLVPELVDSAFPKDPINQDNVVQMFESDFEREATGPGWTVYLNVRILWGLGDAYKTDKTYDCQSGKLDNNRSTLLVYAIAK